jgi:hypothetical protein
MVKGRHALLVLMTLSQITTAGTFTNPTGRPIGGGESYGRWILPSDATYIVASKAELLDRLNNAQRGDVIYVEDDAVIDLTGEWNIVVPPGVTLASGRGRNGSMGAHILTTERANEPLFNISGSFVRITGLRLQGPTVKSDFDGECERNEATGILAERNGSSDPFSNIEIDNNELWAWPAQAINVTGTSDAHVHHNHLHHNRRYENDPECPTSGRGWGYGVFVSLGYALIEANLFNHNRHDIASSGYPLSSYEARYNLVVEGSMDHNFDVHGCQDHPSKLNCRDTPYIAGDTIRIYANSFLDDAHEAIMIRGTPRIGGELYNNRFRQTTLFTGPSWRTDKIAAIAQRYVLGNLTYWDNELGVTVLPGWFISHDGAGFWKLRATSRYKPKALAVGDFDGDGKHDVFVANGTAWYVSREARQRWMKWNTSSTTLDQLAFGDFNGDKKTDVFRANGTAWFVSWGGQSRWSKLRNSDVPLTKLGFGDFNGDGKTDVWHTDGANWYVSWSGTSAWRPLVRSTLSNPLARSGPSAPMRPLAPLALLAPLGALVPLVPSAPLAAALAVSRTLAPCSGRLGSRNCARALYKRSATLVTFLPSIGIRPTSVVGLSDLRFGDFNGDGKTDAFRTDHENWYVSWSTQSGWTKLNRSSTSLRELRFCDFDGDGVTDVARDSIGSSVQSWKVSYGAQTSWQDLRVFSSGPEEPADEFVSITQAALADYNGDGKCDALAQRRF